MPRSTEECWFRMMLTPMPRHFQEFISARTSPGLILIPQRLGIGTAIEELLLVWECNEAREFLNQVLYLPL